MDDDIIAKSALRAMEACCANHPNDPMIFGRCKNHAVPRLPSRVIDVGGDDSLGAFDPKLHVSSDDEHADYACLTYCWGGAQQYSTTSETLERNIQGLRLDSLSRTIQDAVKVTRMLKIRYLWVDSLCIIQDDLADKSQQLEGMGLIYKNSTVTIAAANAKTVNDGFLRHWSVDHGSAVLPFLLPSKATVGSVKVVQCKFSQTAGWWPLDRRAWTLQEYLLSPRLLIFGAGGPVWQCQIQHYEPIVPSDKFFTTELQRLPQKVFSAIQLPKNSNSQVHTSNGMRASNTARREQQQIWKSLVENYSAREITYASDRPEAIAGITNELSRIWGDQCTFGIWKSNFVSQLCWIAWTPTLWNKSHAVPGVPSWSWIGVNRAVRHADIKTWSNDTAAMREEAQMISSNSMELVLEAPLMTTNDMTDEQRMGVFYHEFHHDFNIVDNWLDSKYDRISYERCACLAIFPDFEIDEEWDLGAKEGKWDWIDDAAYAVLGNSSGQGLQSTSIFHKPLANMCCL